MSDKQPQPAATLFGMIIVTPDDRCRKAIDAAIGKVSGLEKAHDHISESAARSRYKTVPARLIVNVPADFMLKALGPHRAVCALNTENPSQAAEVFAETLHEHGLHAKCHHKLEPEYPMLSFVTIEELPDFAFLMWPGFVPANAPALK